jgi:hypothetical protein
MTEAKLASLDSKIHLIESTHFEGVTYAIDRKGKYTSVIAGNTILDVDVERFSQFVQEWYEVVMEWTRKRM